VAVEELLAEELLAEELAGWSTHTVTDSPSSVGLVVQPDALALEDCAKAAGANSNAPITDRPINSNNLLTVFLPRWVPFQCHVRHEAYSGSRKANFLEPLKANFAESPFHALG
jgi:hypothetical protein